MVRAAAGSSAAWYSAARRSCERASSSSRSSTQNGRSGRRMRSNESITGARYNRITCTAVGRPPPYHSRSRRPLSLVQARLRNGLGYASKRCARSSESRTLAISLNSGSIVNAVSSTVMRAAWRSTKSSGAPAGPATGTTNRCTSKRCASALQHRPRAHRQPVAAGARHQRRDVDQAWLHTWLLFRAGARSPLTAGRAIEIAEFDDICRRPPRPSRRRR